MTKILYISLLDCAFIRQHGEERSNLMSSFMAALYGSVRRDSSREGC